MTKRINSNDPEYVAMRKELGGVDVAERYTPERTPMKRREAILRAWAAGMTFAELAERFELKSPAAARAVVEMALADSDISIDRAAERARFTLSLLQHHQTAAARASDPDDPDQMAWMRMDIIVIDRMAKLLGLDAPQQVVVTPGASEFEKLTAAVAVANGAAVVEEADPMAEDYEEAEVVEDE